MNPIIVNGYGEHNFPFPRRSVWWRTWKMLYDVSGIPRAEFCRTFDRINLSPTAEPDRTKSCVVAELIWEGMAGRKVMILGRMTHKAFNLPTSAMLTWNETDNVQWCWVPHPSWMGIEYSEIGIRLGVGYRLESMLNT